ncbi:DUF2637 domain-containing protein [Microbispora cellulosiformans]|uniref:DUF2637 domain-containing protein n=1 Tax=Microbispora cellulosiformans TaxID=2614688 RepID=A0A5J5JUE4_9ACTN|nr:DUF2637 domain-containing protein [Microbispora cellulosiformans]
MRITATLSVLLVAAIVSYHHMHELVRKYGEGDWAAALIPLSVDGTIIAASMSLLLAAGTAGAAGRCRGSLPNYEPLLEWARLQSCCAQAGSASAAKSEDS